MAIFVRHFTHVFMALLSLMPAFASADAVPVTFPSPLTGLWWNPQESGWGISVTQHGSVIFAAWYTYDASGKPMWYVMSSCPIVGNTCTSDLYATTGGRALTADWSGATIAPIKVGTGTLKFSDNNNGRLSFTINGASGSKAITRQVFAASGATPSTNYSDLWWNDAESGWGAAITHEFGIAFVTIFTYDAAARPIWYVASNCTMTGSSCSGALYQVTGGAAPTVAWNSNGLAPTQVGTITINFTDSSTATMHYSINSVTGAKAITRQAFAGEGLPVTAYSDVFDGYSDLLNGGYREHAVQVTDSAGGNSIGCGFDSGADRGTAETAIQIAGGQITSDTDTEFCAIASSESACIEQIDNVIVIDDTQAGVRTIETYMGGLLRDHLSTVIADSFNPSNENITARAKDSSIGASGACSNAGRPILPNTAINGNWTGYGFQYSPASRTGFTMPATMGCVNQTCTILSGVSGTFAFTNQLVWRTAPGASPLAGATLTEDTQIATAFICSVPLDESRTYQSCTFFSFKRP